MGLLLLVAVLTSPPPEPLCSRQISGRRALTLGRAVLFEVGALHVVGGGDENKLCTSCLEWWDERKGQPRREHQWGSEVENVLVAFR